MKRNGATAKGLEVRLRDAELSRVKDPRRRASIKYPLAVVLRTLVVAIMTGAESMRQVEQRTLQIVKKKGSWKGLVKRIADNTFGRLINSLDFGQLQASLHRLVKAEHRRGNLAPVGLEMGAVAIDGKHVATLNWKDLCRLVTVTDEQGRQRSMGWVPATEENIERMRQAVKAHYPNAQFAVPEEGEPHAKVRMHTVTLISSGPSVCVHQRPIPGNTNEIGAMGSLVKELRRVYGRTNLFRYITTDAGNTSQPMAAQILDHGFQYFGQIKANNGEIYSEAVSLLGDRTVDQADDFSCDLENGAVATYHVWSFDLGPEGWLDWNHARQLVRIQRQTEDKTTGKISLGNRYYVVSQPSTALPAKSALALSRAHWRCENNTHWTSDAILGEDRRRHVWSRHPNGLLVIAALRAIALFVLSIARHLSKTGYDDIRPSWSMVMTNFLLLLCAPVLDMTAFDAV